MVYTILLFHAPLHCYFDIKMFSNYTNCIIFPPASFGILRPKHTHLHIITPSFF